VSHETELPGGRLEVGGANVIYRYVQRGSDRAENEVWVEVRLDADWVAACLIEPESEKPVIAELRVLPYQDDLEEKALRGPGECQRRGVPSGGVPVEKLSGLRTEEILQRARDRIEQCADEVEYYSDVLADFGL
jgi:hypothetical protein